MSRPQSLVERVEHLLEDSAPDEIAVLLNISEAEVRRIAQLLDERGPADPKPLPAEDVQAVAVEVEDLPDEPVIYGDDIRRLLSDDPDHADSLARRALLTVAEHSETQHDVEDLAGMLGLTGALTDWQPSVQGPGNPSGNSRAVTAPQAPMTGEQGPSIPVENHATEDVAALAREMAETFTAIDEAVDAITPEHIEARLAHVIAVGETWGVEAPQAPMSEPGDATTGPTKPDTLAPTRPMTQRLADHVAVTVCGPDSIDESGGTDPAGHDHDQPCDPCDAPGGTCCEYCSGWTTSEPEQIHKPSIVAEANANDWPPPGHVHDPFPVADETGTFHAECECGTRWDRASCDICGLPVTALVIAQTGLRRHKHHQTGATA